MDASTRAWLNELVGPENHFTSRARAIEHAVRMMREVAEGRAKYAAGPDARASWPPPTRTPR